jgi:hypothetical protein
MVHEVMDETSLHIYDFVSAERYLVRISIRGNSLHSGWETHEERKDGDDHYPDAGRNGIRP